MSYYNRRLHDFSISNTTTFADEIKTLFKQRDEISVKITEHIQQEILIFKNAERSALSIEQMKDNQNKMIKKETQDNENWLNNLIDKS